MGCEMFSSCKTCQSWRSCNCCHCLRKSTNKIHVPVSVAKNRGCVRAAHTEEAWALLTQLEHWQEPLAQLQLLEEEDPQELENSKLRMSVGSDDNDGRHTSSSVHRSRP